MLVSPSYELARKHRAGQLSATDQARLPTDFGDVLAVYDDLGDVQRVKFDDWWIDKGIQFFGYQGEQPTLAPIDTLLLDDPNQLKTMLINYSEYMRSKWREQGKRPSAIIAIPLYLNRAEIMQQLSRLLDFYDETISPYKDQIAQPAKYNLHGDKRDTKSLFRYLTCISIRASAPELKLYQIGGIAGLSSTYSDRLVADKMSVDDRNALKILTSRALQRGMMIAENAARGIFPSYDKHAHAVTPDWIETGNLHKARMDWGDENT